MNRITSSPDLKRLNWPILLFVTSSPLIAIGGTIWWLAAGHFHMGTVMLALGMAVATGLAITGGYHRLFAHRSFETIWPVRLVLLLLGGAALQESAWDWCRDHRRHHRHIDQENDPYGIQKGFWHAHLWWLFFDHSGEPGERRAPDLWKDPLVRAQHRFYLPSAVLVSFLMPMGIAALWGDAWGGLLIAGLLRLVVNHHLTFLINSACHWIGNQPYSDAHSARDNWWTALFTYGEGYHNFHHEFANDYRNGVKRYHWDPTKWLIRALAQLRLARNLRRTPPEILAKRRMLMQEKTLVATLAERPGRAADAVRPHVAAARHRVHAAAQQIQALRSQQQLAARDAASAFHHRHQELAQRRRDAQREFDRALAAWNATIRNLSKTATA